MSTKIRNQGKMTAWRGPVLQRGLRCIGLAAAVGLACGVFGQAAQGAVTHNLTDSANDTWSTATWTNGVPNAAGDVASFTPTADNTVVVTTLDVPGLVIGELRGGNRTGASWTINPGTGTSITMDNTGGGTNAWGTTTASIAPDSVYNGVTFVVNTDIVMANTDLSTGIIQNMGVTLGGNITAATNQNLILYDNYNSSSAHFNINGSIGASGAGAIAISTAHTSYSMGAMYINGTLGPKVVSLTVGANQSEVVLTGSNVDFTGTTTLSAGELVLSNANALGATGGGGDFTITGGTLSSGNLTLASTGNEFWNGDFSFASTGTLNLSTAAVTLGNNITVTQTSSGTLQVDGVVSGDFGLTLGSGSNSSAKLRLTGANLYTGATTSHAGTIIVSGLGSIGTSSAVAAIGPTGKVNFDYTGSGNNTVDRIGDTVVVTVGSGGEYIQTNNTSGSTRTSETVGGLTIDGGVNTITLNGTSTGVLDSLVIGSTGFSRLNFATALIRGTNLGTAATAANQVTIDGANGTGLTLVGTDTSSSGAGTAGTDVQLKIVPYFIGASTPTGVGANFLTYDTDPGTGGLRLLATGEQSLIGSASANDNVKTAAGDNVVSGPQVFNSLLAGAGAAATPATTATTVTGSGTLTLTSGALANVATGAAGSSTIGGFDSIVFGTVGANEAVITNTNGTAGGTLTIASPIDTAAAGGGLTKSGAGLLVLTGDNLYTGATTINQGALQIGDGTSGSIMPTGGVSVVAGTTLSVNLADNGVLGNNIVNGGVVSKTLGANVNEISGNISGSGSVAMSAAGGTLKLSGDISGMTSVAMIAAGGMMALSGANSYTGNTLISAGTLEAVDGASLPSTSLLQLGGGVLQTNGAFTRSLGTTAGNVAWTAGGGFAARGGDLVVKLNNGTGTVNWANTASFIPNGQALIFGSSTADGLADFQNGITLTQATSGVANRTVSVLDNPDSSSDRARISGLISNGRTAGQGLIKAGDGVLELTHADTYTGTTTITAGTLVVGVDGVGSLTSAITVNGGGTLGGSGSTTGSVAVGDGTATAAHISPGNSPGAFTTSADISFASNGVYDYELDSSGGIGDQIVANGVTVDPTALFAFSSVGDESGLSDGQTLLVIDNTSASAILGAFANLADGSTFTAGSFDFTANYAGGSGNDLTLTLSPASTVPEPASLALLGLGAGAMALRRRRRA